MLLAHVKISQKLSLAFAALLVVLVAGSTYVYMTLARLDEARKLTDHTGEVLNVMSVASRALLGQRVEMRGDLYSAEPYYMTAYKDAKAEYEKSINQLRELIQVPSVKEKFDRGVALAQEWTDLVNRYAPLMGNPDAKNEANDSIVPARQKMNAARQAFDEMWSTEYDLLEKRTAIESELNYKAKLYLVVAGAVAVVAAALSGWLLTRAIAHPVAGMTRVMQRLAQGDETTDVPAIGRRDEIGQMANAVQTFKEAAIEKKRLEGIAAEQRAAAQTVQAEAEAEREAASRRLAEVVDGLASGLAQLADGNLTVSLDSEFAAEYERLRNDFNGAVTGLHEAIKVIIKHSEAIGTGTTEIAHASDDLAKRTEQQAASLEQTAAALDQITATVRNTATGSARAQNVAASAKSEAEASGGVVKQAVAAMGEIEGSARQIGQIIGVIDEIAFQTNLLALNAGVEAARAGEAGRGFAVVASEVRALAQRAADAAKEIKTLINTSMQQVERGVRLVGETGQALGRIQNGVSEINVAINEIAASAQEQATGLAEINTAINEMDKVTQQNAAMVEQSTAAARSLSHETEEMTRAVGRFRVASGAVPSRSAAPRPVRSAAPPRAVTQGNTALKITPANEPENWDAF